MDQLSRSLQSLGSAPSSSAAGENTPFNFRKQLDDFIRGQSKDLALKPRIHPAADYELEAKGDSYPVSGRASLGVVTDDPALKDNKFRVGLTGFEKFAAEQKGPEWCWAAAAQIALLQAGHRIEQDDLVEYFRSGADSQTGNLAVIMRALNPEMEKQLEGKLFVPIISAAPTSDMIVGRLSQGEAVIVGLNERPDAPGGHACVIHAATYSERKLNTFEQGTMYLGGDASNDTRWPTRYALHEVEVYDPFPGVGFRKLTGKELEGQAIFLVSRGYARHVIEEYLKQPTKASSGSYRLDLKGVHRVP